jgi:hypothetical protein
MKVASGGFEQCYKAQAVVAAGSLLVVANALTQAGNDKQQLAPMLEKLAVLPKPLGRTRHHVSWKQRFAAATNSLPVSAMPLQKMAHRLKTSAGRKLYGLRKQTPEPVFGIIKSVMGYRQTLLRGLQNVRGEWNLLTLSRNIKRMFALQPCRTGIAASRLITSDGNQRASTRATRFCLLN